MWGCGIILVKWNGKNCLCSFEERGSYGDFGEECYGSVGLWMSGQPGLSFSWVVFGSFISDIGQHCIIVCCGGYGNTECYSVESSNSYLYYSFHYREISH